MEQIIFLIAAFALFVAFFKQNSSRLAFSYTTPNKHRNWAANVYKRSQIWFEKGLEDVEKAFNDGMERVKGTVTEVKKQLEELEKKGAKADELDSFKSEQKKSLDDMQKQLDELQKEAGRLKEQKQDSKGKSMLDQLSEHAVKSLGDSKLKGEDAIKSFLKKAYRLGQGDQEKGVDIDLKAVSDISTSYGLTGTNNNLLRAFTMEPGVSKDPNRPLFILDEIDTGTTASHTVFWNERVLIEGGAGQTAEAAKFPQASFKWQKKSATSKKTAVYTKITEEMIEDVDFVLSEIQSELIDGPAGIRFAIENQILTGDGTGENHNGIFTQATAFAKPAGFDTLANPNNFDLLRAVILQAEKANYNLRLIAMNPSDVANMELLKNNDGTYILPPFVAANGMTIKGVRVLSNNGIAADNFLALDPKLVHLRVNRALTLRFFEQNEDDALTDKQTVTASLRGVLYIKTPDLKGIIKGTLAAGKNLIKTV